MRKVKSENSQEVLRRIDEYLKTECGEPVEILCGFWKDQQDAITYQELRQAVLDGMLSVGTIELWRQDYSILVTERLNDMWTKALTAGLGGQPILDNISFEFNTQTPGILGWIKERGANLVTACTEEQRDAIAALLTKKMREEHTVDELARLIRPCIGLTEGQAAANAKYYDSIVANLRKEHPRMKPDSIRKKAREAAWKYAERQHRDRAFTIAQTESAFAYNRGADEGIRQAQEQGYLGIMKKRWSTSGDDGVCDTCAALEGTEADMNSDFNIGGRLLFKGQHMLPPAHPRCACAIEYIEEFQNRNVTVPDSIKRELTAEDFNGGKEDFEITEDVSDLYLTDTSRAKIEDATANIKSAADLQEYLQEKGIALESSCEALKNRWTDEISNVKRQIDHIVAAVEQYSEIGGLSNVKAIHMWEVDLDVQAQYIYRAIGEGVVENEGHIYLSSRTNGFQVMHEFAHAYADSTKPSGMDVVSWSAFLNEQAGLRADATAYFGAADAVIEAEKFADEIGGAISYGKADKLNFLANVANYVLNGGIK